MASSSTTLKEQPKIETFSIVRLSHQVSFIITLLLGEIIVISVPNNYFANFYRVMLRLKLNLRQAIGGILARLGK
jgi:hypothetical protein